MNLRALLPRLSLLGFTAAILAITAVLFAQLSFSPLAPREVNNGTISGQVTGVSPNAQFVITASGIFSDDVTTFTTSTIVNSGSVYTFTNIPAGDDQGLGVGYPSSVVSYTVTAAPLAPCYSVSPVSQSVFLGDGETVTGVNFSASFIPFPVTITIRLTEMIPVPGAIPVTPVITPPNRPNGTGNFTTVTYRIQSADGTISQTQTQNVVLFGTELTFTPTIFNEPANGNCTMPFTVTVVSLLPLYQGVVDWQYVPVGGSQVVTVSATARTVNVPFLAYHHWAWGPINFR